MNDETSVETPKVFLKSATRFLSGAFVRITELAVVCVAGTVIGISFTNHNVIADCQQVAMAKVGDRYITCAMILPKKEPETAPPR